MSRTTSHPVSITGHAVVRLKTGATYVGYVSQYERSVLIDGCLRVISMVDGVGIFTYRPRLRRTVPLHLLREIVWDDDVRREVEDADIIPSTIGEDDAHTHRTAGRQQAS